MVRACRTRLTAPGACMHAPFSDLRLIGDPESESAYQTVHACTNSSRGIRALAGTLEDRRGEVDPARKLAAISSARICELDAGYSDSWPPATRPVDSDAERAIRSQRACAELSAI